MKKEKMTKKTQEEACKTKTTKEGRRRQARGVKHPIRIQFLKEPTAWSFYAILLEFI